MISLLVEESYPSTSSIGSFTFHRSFTFTSFSSHVAASTEQFPPRLCPVCMGRLRTLVDSDGLSTGVAVLGEHGVEAAEAVGPALAHDVPLASQLLVTLETGEVLHVPGPSLSLGTLVRQNDLRAWSQPVRRVSIVQTLCRVPVVQHANLIMAY